MRFCYLRAAVLAGILAATAPAESTSLSARPATLREERSPPSDRDDVAAVGSSVGDEERVREFGKRIVTIPRFIKNVLLDDFNEKDAAVKGSSRLLNKMVKQGKTPQEAYIMMGSDAKKREVLTTVSWKTWAFYASKYCAQNDLDPHEYIFKVMSHHYGASQLSEVLAVAASNANMKNFAEKLQELQLSEWLREQYQPQQVFDLLKVDNAWIDNLFDSPQFVAWTHYLKRLHEVEYDENPIAFEVSSLRKFVSDISLLKMLMLPENALHSKSEKYLELLTSIWLNDRIKPHQMVSMLLQGFEESDHQFRMLFIYETVRNYWRLYTNRFNMRYPGSNALLFERITSIYGLPKLLIKLHATVNMADEEISGMALWYLALQFSEWNTDEVIDIIRLMPDLTSSDKFPAIAVMRNAYIKYTLGYQLSREDFVM